jgi:AcrR family transcriptional regulator
MPAIARPEYFQYSDTLDFQIPTISHGGVAASRLTRAEQVDRNRGLVLEAARRVFLARGYGGASLEAISEEAGFSKGVIYSQFAGKPDLFLALLEARITARAGENAAIAATAAGVDGLRELLEANARRNDDGGDWARLLIEFRVVAARDPELNRRYAMLHSRTLEHFAEAIRRILARGGLTSAHPPRTLAELILALDSGRVLERAAGTSHLELDTLVDLITRTIVPLETPP